ncbi:MAG: alpha/beta hydrolase [Chitinophagales bacterium]|jgi:pimeloyl-ACP methyl ester carboxylesterase|nr:alpha/beta hydrolase [Chitinophagales bacterium]HNI44305.1 alpha/beta hydrolase [Chitinophagales bacterium]HNL06891.1 alpha/beta hydrolase [Chitinophagales bacterium]
MAALTELIHKYTNDASRFMVIDGMLVHYRDEGRGFPILMVHGAFSSLHTFDGWAKHLKQYYRVIRLDLPGFGLTGPNPENNYSIPNHIRIVNILLNRLGVHACNVIGSSLGGWLSWEFALRYPERVQKMVLIDSAGFLDQKTIPVPFRMARTPFADKVVKYVIQKPILEQFLRQVYFDQSKITPSLIDRYYDLFTREGNPEAFLKLVNDKHKDNTRHLKQIETPTLVMWGTEDRWVPVEYAYKFKQELPNAKLVLYKNVGHIPMEEVPSITIKETANFLTHPEAVSYSI